MKSWKKAAGLYAAYRIGQARQKEEPKATQSGSGLSGVGWKLVWIVYSALGLILAAVLIKLGF